MLSVARREGVPFFCGGFGIISGEGFDCVLAYSARHNVLVLLQIRFEKLERGGHNLSFIVSVIFRVSRVEKARFPTESLL